MVDGAVPGVRTPPACQLEESVPGDRGIEAVGNKCGKRRVQFIELRVEFFPGSERFDEGSRARRRWPAKACNTSRSAASPREGDRTLDHRDFDALRSNPTRFIEKREEQGLLAREMKVESAFGRIRGAGDLVDRGVAVAVLGEDLECGVEHPLSPRSTSFLDVGHHSPVVKTDRLVGRIF